MSKVYQRYTVSDKLIEKAQVMSTKEFCEHSNLPYQMEMKKATTVGSV